MSLSANASALACPLCLGDLRPDADALSCAPCSRRYPLAGGRRPDFRIPGTHRIRFEYAYDTAWGAFPWDLARLRWPEAADPEGRPPVAGSFEVAMSASFPRASAGNRSLDLGCGTDYQRFEKTLVDLGYDHVGVDISGEAPDVLADMHLLPFRDESFDLLVTTAVFEHVKNPHVAMTEAARVARPGAVFVGSVAFSEAFHISYFHHSPLAVYELLESSGFESRAFVLSREWNAFSAHLEMGYAGARLPRLLQRLIAKGIFRTATLPAAVKALLKRSRGPMDSASLAFARSHSASVGFVAVRRPAARENRSVR